ncbi:hypothetical protein JRQ81_012878, partial [Phrynocephalus forsythii]
FWTVTANALARAGIVGWHFGSYSFRIGEASTAAALGYDAAGIQRSGVKARARVVIFGHSFVFWAA